MSNMFHKPRPGQDDMRDHHNNQSHNKSPPPQSAMPTALSPQQTCEALVESAIARHNQRVDILFLKAIWGGIFLSYGGFLSSVVGSSTSAAANNAGLLRLAEGFAFPVGLTLIVLTGTELLTSDMMIIVLGVLKHRVPWWGVLYNWIVVFFGNLAGSLFFGAILARFTGLSTGAVGDFITSAANTRSHINFLQVFLRGIGCNIMVCASVFVASQSSELIGKIVGIYVVLSAFVALSFEHVIADMFTIPLGIQLGHVTSVGTYIWKDIIGALLGNIVGALLLGFSLWWMYLHNSPQPAKVTDAEKGPRETDSQDTVGEHGANPHGRGPHF